MSGLLFPTGRENAMMAPARSNSVGSGPIARVHDRGPRLDVLVAERVAELVDPQQPPAAVVAIELAVEVHRAADDAAVGLFRPQAVADRPGESDDAVVAADDDLPGPQRVDARARRRTLDLDRGEARERVAGEEREPFGEVRPELRTSSSVSCSPVAS